MQKSQSMVKPKAIKHHILESELQNMGLHMHLLEVQEGNRKSSYKL